MRRCAEYVLEGMWGDFIYDSHMYLFYASLRMLHTKSRIQRRRMTKVIVSKGSKFDRKLSGSESDGLVRGMEKLFFVNDFKILILKFALSGIKKGSKVKDILNFTINCLARLFSAPIKFHHPLGSKRKQSQLTPHT